VQLAHCDTPNSAHDAIANRRKRQREHSTPCRRRLDGRLRSLVRRRGDATSDEATELRSPSKGACFLGQHGEAVNRFVATPDDVVPLTGDDGSKRDLAADLTSQVHRAARRADAALRQKQQGAVGPRSAYDE
jgi:hypothetical protein